ncbi:hypothetical protein HNP82_003139 [Catenibacillus scindens]|uniref:Uncharacterized protein n=1 Tax=Catenibacillus scindens TaxID=673271 RepID=A0A7W8M6V5_9FIRM|nr:hypothetical protein [Catenibacillus scindens]MBB5265987.1 hypothetical protein [Catenibacillus scindens]
MKVLKRIVTPCLSSILVLMIFFNFNLECFAYDFDGTTDTYEEISSEEISDNLLVYLDSLNIDTQAIEKIQLSTPVQTRQLGSSENKLFITTGNDQEKHIYVLQNLQEKNGIIEPCEVIKKVSTRASGSDQWTPSGTGVTLVNMASYNIYQNGKDVVNVYYNPYSLITYYRINSGSYVVKSFTTEFTSIGEVTTYPGFVGLGYNSAHVISLSQSAPIEYNMYSRISYFSSGPTQLLRIVAPSTSHTMSIDSNIVINNTLYMDSYYIPGF